MNSTVSLDKFVKEIEELKLVDKCIQLAFTKGKENNVIPPPPRNETERKHQSIAKNLCGSTLFYEDDKIKLFVHQYILGGNSVKVYSKEPVKLVFEAISIHCDSGYAPIINENYKLIKYQKGNWIDNLARIVN